MNFFPVVVCCFNMRVKKSSRKNILRSEKKENVDGINDEFCLEGIMRAWRLFLDIE